MDAIIAGKVVLPRVQCRYFSHLFELEQTDEEAAAFVSGVLENPENGRLFSAQERQALRRAEDARRALPEEE